MAQVCGEDGGVDMRSGFTTGCQHAAEAAYAPHVLNCTRAGSLALTTCGKALATWGGRRPRRSHEWVRRVRRPVVGRRVVRAWASGCGALVPQEPERSSQAAVEKSAWAQRSRPDKDIGSGMIGRTPIVGMA